MIDISGQKIEVVDGQQLSSLLNPHTLKYLDLGDTIGQSFVDAKRFISSGRFDLFAKFAYARLRRIEADTDWGARLYIEHMEVFNGLNEKDGSGKEGAEAFLNTFDSLLDSVAHSGLDSSVSLVPVGKGDLVIDGIHRVTASLVSGTPVPTAFFDAEVRHYNFAYFRRKGLGEPWLDAMANELLSLKRNLFVAILFPAARGKRKKAEAMIRGCGDIYYEKDVTLNERGAFNFIRQIYSREPWVGNWRDGFGGARKKSRRCFPVSGSMRVYIFEAQKLIEVRNLKDQIRRLYGAGNHSLHISDTHQEAVETGRLLFNANSIHFLNHARPRSLERFTPYLKKYKAWLYQESLNFEHFCVDGSAIMGAYGLRDSRDLDFLHFEHEGIRTGMRGIDSHNEAMLHHSTSRDDILFNPENHFWYDGVKFATLGVLRAMKAARGEEKDRRDLTLIDALVENGRVPVASSERNPIKCWITAGRRWLKLRRQRAKYGAPSRGPKIVGLVAGRNERARISFCLKALSVYTDAIVYLDDFSDDDTVGLVESIADECRVERVICKSSWIRDEPGDRNKLLEAGREIGGTHFIVIDADEAFTANCYRDGFLRERILSLQPGEQLALLWIQLWRSVRKYRDDDSVWSGRYKRCIFCDNGKARYKSRFIHTSRVPKIKGRCHNIEVGGFGLLHFQFVNWDNLKLKQRWYRCLERVRDFGRPIEEINKKYAASVDESDLRLSDAPREWLSGYSFFNKSICDTPDDWRDIQIKEWEKKYGQSFFDGLE